MVLLLVEQSVDENGICSTECIYIFAIGFVKSDRRFVKLITV